MLLPLFRVSAHESYAAAFKRPPGGGAASSDGFVISFKSPVYLKCLSQCGPISNPQLVLDSAADAVRSPPDRPREATLY